MDVVKAASTYCLKKLVGGVKAVWITENKSSGGVGGVVGAIVLTTHD